MFNLFVIGVSDNTLSAANLEILAQCSSVFATPRLQKIISHLPLEINNISPVQEATQEIKAKLKLANIAVLASGDPLFYGIGKRLLSEVPQESIEFHPAVSSIQKAAALFKTHWDDATILSLHGRNHPHVAGLILKHPKCFILTDTKNSPNDICKKIQDYLDLIDDKKHITNISVMVAENIGLPDQRLFSGNLSQTCEETFSSLNIMFIHNHAPCDNGFPAALGLLEDEVIHSRGLITKSEVRAATIHQLRLPKTGVLWDVGAGSGSISIEAARSHPELTIFAVEHKREEINNIKANIRKFGCYNIIPVFGKAPESLRDLPAPDRIFVGGSSGTLPAITDIAKNRLPADGRIVINGVIEKTIKEAPELLSRCHFSVETTTISVIRTDNVSKKIAFNPITITTGSR